MKSLSGGAHLLLVLLLVGGSIAGLPAVGRRAFVGSALSAVVAPRAARAVVLRQAPAAWQPAGDASDATSYFEQLRAGRSEMQRCLTDWVALTHADRDTDFDGDAVRRIIGTVGTASPLLRIDKVFDRLRIAILDDPKYADVDVERFVELAESIVQGLRDTDYLAYVRARPSIGAASES
jgi:hypothetical protein